MKKRNNPRMVQFITLDEDEKDLVVSYALADSNGGIRSLNLLRTLFFEELLDEEERGVNVWLEKDHFDDKARNMLIEIQIEENEISIHSTFRDYQLDISRVDREEIEEMIRILKKQNYDNRFTIRIA